MIPVGLIFFAEPYAHVARGQKSNIQSTDALRLNSLPLKGCVACDVWDWGGVGSLIAPVGADKTTASETSALQGGRAKDALFAVADDNTPSNFPPRMRHCFPCTKRRRRCCRTLWNFLPLRCWNKASERLLADCFSLRHRSRFQHILCLRTARVVDFPRVHFFIPHLHARLRHNHSNPNISSLDEP